MPGSRGMTGGQDPPPLEYDKWPKVSFEILVRVTFENQMDPLGLNGSQGMSLQTFA